MCNCGGSAQRPKQGDVQTGVASKGYYWGGPKKPEPKPQSEKPKQ